MVRIIRADSVNELFIYIARALYKDGHIRSPRGLKTVEVNDIWLEYSNPTINICSLPSRNINMDYLNGEMDWYDQGSLFVDDIAKHSSFWWKLADRNGTVNSNYGFLTRVEKFAGISQYEWCIDKLKEDIFTRQAIMNYNQPRHKYPGVKDMVCTISQQFRINESCAIDTVVLMRSQDFIYGLSYDIVWFCKMLISVCCELQMPIGNYIHYAQSEHVYERHFDMLKAMAEEKL